MMLHAKIKEVGRNKMSERILVASLHLPEFIYLLYMIDELICTTSIEYGAQMWF